MPAQIIVTIQDNRSVSYSAAGSPLDLATALGALDCVRLTMAKSLLAPAPKVAVVPAAALLSMPGRNGDG